MARWSPDAGLLPVHRRLSQRQEEMGRGVTDVFAHVVGRDGRASGWPPPGSTSGVLSGWCAASSIGPSFEEGPAPSRSRARSLTKSARFGNNGSAPGTAPSAFRDPARRGRLPNRR
jgi:hypothetical protein